MKAARPAGAGIQPEQPLPLFLQILVGVAEYHDIDPGQICGNLLAVVNQIERDPLEGDSEIMRNLCGPILVVVAPNDIERGVLAQLVKDELLVDVPGMKDGVGMF